VRDLIRQLTPVVLETGLYVKRDDLFSIQVAAPLSGGKLRQCLLMLEGLTVSRLMSAASIHSPQSAIVAYVARHLGLPCRIFVGGKQETASLTLARSFGADIVRCPTGRHTVLFAKARGLRRDGDFIVPFGMRPERPSRSFYEVCGAQIRNIPSHIHTIVIASGSGVTATAVAYGLWNERRTHQRIAMINLGPDRRYQVLRTLREINQASARWAESENVIHAFQLSQRNRFRYESQVQFQLGEITLHPLYEAKAFSWFTDNVTFDPSNTLFWVTGPPLGPKILHNT
jgi:1-aminocyclopropane-1-carboxylate deaminase/D-cysteine desulfhydrase-like pyridoxal-dependent ACC family enzyme